MTILFSRRFTIAHYKSKENALKGYIFNHLELHCKGAILKGQIFCGTYRCFEIERPPPRGINSTSGIFSNCKCKFKSKPKIGRRKLTNISHGDYFFGPKIHAGFIFLRNMVQPTFVV